MKTKAILASLLVLLIYVSCENPKGKSNSEQSEQSEQKSEHAKWDYSGESGPEHWAQLEQDSECDGLHQSPINIIDVETSPGNFLGKIDEMIYEDETTIRSITNNGHTIQYNFDGDLNTMEYEGKKFKMIQFHFHALSEHTINGVRYPLEIHLVHHCEETDSYIVLALLVQQGEPDPTFTFLDNYLPIQVGETLEINESYNLGSKVSDIFGMDSVDVFTYEGSLTTPPCTQDVLWIVVKNASSASPAQIEALQSLMPKNNYRDTQEINDRVIHHEKMIELF